MIGRPPVPAKVRFWRYVRKRLDGCWWWTGSVCRGYGQFRGDGPRFKMYKAHVFSWKLHHGEVPKGLLVCHSCDVRHCVNPNHLWLGTQKDNLDDMRRKGRQPDMRGPKNPMYGKRGFNNPNFGKRRIKSWN